MSEHFGILYLREYFSRRRIIKITLQMVPGYPAGILGRNGFRGGFPHAARRMLSYEETHNLQKPDDIFQESLRQKMFLESQNLDESLHKNDNRKAINENFSHLYNRSIRLSSYSTLAYERDSTKYPQKIPWQRRSLLWSPPQIFSSVLKVFRKVFAYMFSY